MKRLAALLVMGATLSVAPAAFAQDTVPEAPAVEATNNDDSDKTGLWGLLGLLGLAGLKRRDDDRSTAYRNTGQDTAATGTRR